MLLDFIPKTGWSDNFYIMGTKNVGQHKNSLYRKYRTRWLY